MKPLLRRNLEQRILHKFTANLTSRQMSVCSFNPKNYYNLTLWGFGITKKFLDKIILGIWKQHQIRTESFNFLITKWN